MERDVSGRVEDDARGHGVQVLDDDADLDVILQIGDDERMVHGVVDDEQAGLAVNLAKIEEQLLQPAPVRVVGARGERGLHADTVVALVETVQTQEGDGDDGARAVVLLETPREDSSESDPARAVVLKQMGRMIGMSIHDLDSSLQTARNWELLSASIHLLGSAILVRLHDLGFVNPTVFAEIKKKYFLLPSLTALRMRVPKKHCLHNKLARTCSVLSRGQP